MTSDPFYGPFKVTLIFADVQVFHLYTLEYLKCRIFNTSSFWFACIYFFLYLLIEKIDIKLYFSIISYY